MVLHLSSDLLASDGEEGIAGMPSDCSCKGFSLPWPVSVVLFLHLAEEAAGRHGINLRGNTKGIYFYGNLLLLEVEAVDETGKVSVTW